jgi:hypothetical protein
VEGTGSTALKVDSSCEIQQRPIDIDTERSAAGKGLGIALGGCFLLWIVSNSRDSGVESKCRPIQMAWWIYKRWWTR